MRLIIFIVGTLGIAYFSWRLSIREKRFHGIYRFFVFEGILGLILLNYPYWFNKPFSLPQIISWIVLIGAIPLSLGGYYSLKMIGEPRGNFENTSKLVMQGIYKYIRHPMYASLTLLLLGIFLKHVSVINTFIFSVSIIFLFATAKKEEKEMIQKFGDEYTLYLKKTKMFIPFIL